MRTKTTKLLKGLIQAFTLSLFMGGSYVVYGQSTGNNPDSLRQSILNNDLLKNINAFGSIQNSARSFLKWPSFSLPKFNFRKPLSINGGSLTYYFDYRASIDTPFAEKNITQNSLIGNMNVTLFNALPLNVSFFIRRTNSSLFSSINDVRVDFNAAQYAETIKQTYLKKLNSKIPDIKDSLMNKIEQLEKAELARIRSQLSKRDLKQKLVECNEIIHIPAIAEAVAGPLKADSVRKKAKEFMDSYNDLKKDEAFYKGLIDSLHTIVTGAVAKAKKIRELLSGNFNSYSGADAMKELKKLGVNIPPALQRLMSLRHFSLGRSQLNYSELTARNLSLNGINIEYNSWYYFALAAGTIDYRFRDFVVSGFKRKPQYMYLARIGLGRLEKNYIILSAYKGQKQSYIQQSSNTSSSSQSLDIYGLSLEAKYRLNHNSYVIAEVAESATAGLNLGDPPKSQKLFNWNDKTNKAYSVKMFSYLPRSKTRLEGAYRYNGAGFQSFDRFQVNSSQKSWHIKGEQYFLKKQLKLVASMQSNEFSNPYIIQQYKSNMVFKTVQLTFRRKGWPVVSAGLMPSSQLTNIGGQLTENHFHTLNIVAYHQYKVGFQNNSTTITFNRFYNTPSDTSFLYFNAVNFYLQHYIFFKYFTAGIGGSHSSNNDFELNVLEESLVINMPKNSSLGGGVKINSYNKGPSELGYWFRMGCRFMKTGSIQAQYDDGLIPGSNKQLISNKWFTLSITKIF